MRAHRDETLACAAVLPETTLNMPSDSSAWIGSIAAPYQGHGNNSLHFMVSAFAIQKVSRFARAFAFAPLGFFASADIGADFRTADDFLFHGADELFLVFRHFQIPWSSLEQPSTRREIGQLE